MVHTVCLIAALVVFALATFMSHPRINLTALGLTLLTLSFVLHI